MKTNTRRVEQCIGCQDDVVIRSERQLVSGEAFCATCRRNNTDAVRAAASARLAAAATSRPKRICAHVFAGITPVGSPAYLRGERRFCTGCLASESI